MKICDLMLEDLKKRLSAKNVGLEITDNARIALVENGYDQNYGARPLRRYIQQYVETLVAKKIIADDVLPETTLTVDYENDHFVVK